MEKNEYELQHFDFSAVQVTLERSHSLKNILSKTLDLMMEKILKDKSDKTRELLLQQKAEVIKNMYESFKEPLDAMRQLDQHTFSIPDHVLLPSDFDCAKKYTAEDEARVDKQLVELKQRFLENSVMIETLRMENVKYEDIESIIADELQLHAEVQESFHNFDLKKLVDFVNNTQQHLELDNN